MGYSQIFITQYCVQLPHTESLEELSETLWDGRVDYEGFDKNFKADLDFNWMRIGPVLFQSVNFRWGDGNGDWDKQIPLKDLSQIKNDFIAQFKYKLGEEFSDILGELINNDNWKLVSYVHIN